MKSRAIIPKANTKIVIDTRRALNDGTYPVKIRITFKRRQVYYPTPYSLTVFDFAEAMERTVSDEDKKKFKAAKSKKKSKSDLKEIGLELQAYEKKAAEIIKNLPVFTSEFFDQSFLTNRIENDTISNSFEKHIKDLKGNEQIGTAVSYGCAKKSLETFNPKLKFTDITPDVLRKYERWMVEKGRSFTTISMYLRHLRTLFNTAISNQLIPKEIYPFGKNRYEVPTGNNKKKAITLPEIALIYNLEIEPGTTRAMARDYWFFMYLCNGMNMKDMCLLRYKNIKENVLEFERAKTKRTKRNVELIRVVITEDVARIISVYGNKYKDPENYIFPVLNKGITAIRERQLVQQITHLINGYMKEIASSLGIQNKLGTYTARHSFATVLQRSGATTSFISEALGHSNEKTTQYYLAGFEDSQKAETVKALTAFKNVKSESV